MLCQACKNMYLSFLYYVKVNYCDHEFCSAITGKTTKNCAKDLMKHKGKEKKQPT